MTKAEEEPAKDATAASGQPDTEAIDAALQVSYML